MKHDNIFMKNSTFVKKSNLMKVDVLIIGSSAAGAVAATTGKRIYPEKKFLVISKHSETLVPCGIPYIFGSIGNSENNLIPMQRIFASAGIEMMHNEVIAIDRDKKNVKLSTGDIIGYEKLVLATGSVPFEPVWLNGRDLENVFYVPKDKSYIDQMQRKLVNVENVIVIGAGFIGVEIADELNKIGKKVTLIENQENILHIAFNNLVSEIIENMITKEGVNVLTSSGVKEILGNTKVEGVLLENGERILADAVVLSMGYSPNSQLAIDSDLAVRSNGAIKVDEYMRTYDPCIFAIGDCAEKRDFITRKPSKVMLASTASAEARIAGMSLYQLSAIKTFNGTISIFSTSIGGLGFGVAGLTEKEAEKEGFNVVTGEFNAPDKHPKTLKGTERQYVKLIVGVEGGLILGGVAYGGLSVGELINVIGVIIQSRMNLNSLLTLQIGTHPLLTASAAAYPLIKAAENASDKICLKRK